MNRKPFSHSPGKTSFVMMFIMLLAACTPTPENERHSDALPPMYPDYTDIWVPCNIAPLNFMLRNDAEAIQLVATQGEEQIQVNERGAEICFDIDEWHEFIHHAAGKTVDVIVTALKDGQWTAYKPFQWHVTNDSIDPYLTYRLIEPDYEIYQNLSLQERCIENFDERSISNYGLTGNRCMNCHTYANQRPDLSMFYIRGEGGGAILNRNGQLSKLNIKAGDMVSGSVYFGFSPTGKYITFSSNVIIPAFHAKPNKRLEVFDSKSDVYVADMTTNTIIKHPLLSDSLRYETFPTFSPDGKYIYFCSAPPTRLPEGLEEMRYSLCRISFDEQTGAIGTEIDTLFNGPAQGLSVCHPRISPDGQHLVFSVANYGTFPIWHPEADLYMLHLTTGVIDKMEIVNSEKSDTYHSWSSNSRWLVFASKRDDGLYGKPYFCYIDEDGQCHKPFVLPQEKPHFYDFNLKSFNAPELGCGKLPFTAADAQQALQGEGIDFHISQK